MISVALDTNLLLLLVVGYADPRNVERYKRTSMYRATDFALLVDTIRNADRIVATPNALTEVSNLTKKGLAEPLSTAVRLSLKRVINEVHESYRASRLACQEPEFDRRGLCDTAWLGVIDSDTILVTDDGPLYRAALNRGMEALSLSHLREEGRLVRRVSRKKRRRRRE